MQYHLDHDLLSEIGMLLKDWKINPMEVGGSDFQEFLIGPEKKDFGLVFNLDLED